MPNKPDFDKNSWGTPQALFDALDDIFHFTIDIAASKENAKCKRFYTIEDNGLSKSWAGETVFCNPPYGKKLLEPWVKKAFLDTSFMGRAGEIENMPKAVVFILPARTSQPWFHKFCLYSSVFFIRGRIGFVPPVGRTKLPTMPTEHHLVVVFGRITKDQKQILQRRLSNATLEMRGKGKKTDDAGLFK